MNQGPIVRIALGVFGLLTLAIILLALFNDKGALQVHAQAQKLDAINAENRKLESENKKTSDEIKALKSNDPATIERLAREELRLVKPGEVILVTPGK